MSTAPAMSSAPTEAEPQPGCVSLRVGDQDIMIAEGERWVDEHGDHVIRSLEFDVIAGAGTFEDALSAFVDRVVDFAVYLSELDQLAENEEEMFHLIAPRLFRASREFERLLEPKRKRPLISLNLGRRRRREDVREWHPSSRQPGSRLPSPA